MSDDFEDFPGLLTHQETHEESHQGSADEPPFRSRGRVEVFIGASQRRRWTPQEKARITRESFGPGVRVSDVARRHSVSQGLLHQWRKQAREAGGGGPTFVPVHVDDKKPGSASAKAVIEIDVGGATIRVNGRVDAEWLRLVVAAVRPRG
jgi:transposase